VSAGHELDEVDLDHPDFPLRLDPSRASFVSAWGKKRSGKSAFNRLIYSEWPGDKLCIDVNGDADPGPDAEKVTLPLPTKFPSPAPALGERRKPLNLHFRAHPGSATFRDDLDRAVGMALYPQAHPCLLWAGEVGELQPNGHPGPHMRTVLMQNRHYNVSCLFDGPRPVNVDTLTLSQSDLVAVFRLPNPADRKRVADTIGFGPKEFDRECFETWRRGPHHFLLWHSEQETLWRCPPLPLEEKAAA
jgi:hypothetical protein